MIKKRARGLKSIEFVLAIIVAVLIVSSLLSQDYFGLPQEVVSFLIFAFVLIKLYDYVKNGGSIFEDYVALTLIIIFGVMHFFLGNEINAIVLVVMVFILVYSVGLIPWIDDLFKSKKFTTFILSYAFFVIMVTFLFAGAYYSNGGDFTYLGEQTSISFEDSLYFSIISFTTVGYGEISPLGLNKLISSIQALLGMMLNIGFIGYILASKRFRR
jgi:UDP-N-acetylmuramyl pentapeptide phosphotransferase/UDP-N-acetylglucosamine-1-phosphate transferase